MAFIKKTFLVFILLFFLVASSLASANDNLETQINLLGFDEANYQVSFLIVNLETNEEKKGFSNKDELFLSLDRSLYSLELLLNNENTEGYDYFGSEIFLLSEESQEVDVLVFPVSNLEIKLSDGKKNLRNVLVYVRCKNKYGDQGYFYSDEMGFVLIRPPVGKCLVRAAYEDEVLTESVKLNKGEMIELSFVFQRDKNNFLFWTLFFIVIFLALLFVAKRVLISDVKTKNISKKNDEPYRKDAFIALSSKEKKIVSFLLEQKEVVYQAKIVYGTKIPKTTLAKILPELENKKIVEVEKVGKAKKVKLTPWFKKEK